MNFFKRIIPCSCLKQQINEDGNIKEDVTITIKNTCCRRSKIININITKDNNNTETINEIKNIMDKIINI